MTLRGFCFNILCITFGPAFAFSDFDVTGCLGFEFDVFYATALFFLVTKPYSFELLTLPSFIFLTEDGLRIIRNVSN